MEGSVAVVTGGASGIGGATVALLRDSGVDVHVVDRVAEPPRKTRGELERALDGDVVHARLQDLLEVVARH